MRVPSLPMMGAAIDLARTAFPATRAYLLQTQATHQPSSGCGPGVIVPARRHVRQPGPAASACKLSRLSPTSRSSGHRCSPNWRAKGGRSAAARPSPAPQART
jgi:hypothetical protein